MPYRKKGGNNATRQKKKHTELQYPDASNGELLGHITKLQGNCHFDITTIAGDEKKASLKGTIKKRSRCRIGDLVLIEPLSEDPTGKYQIIFKYTPDQVARLKKEGCLNNVEQEDSEDDEPDFMFTSEVKSKEEKIDIDNTDFIDLI